MVVHSVVTISEVGGQQLRWLEDLSRLTNINWQRRR